MYTKYPASQDFMVTTPHCWWFKNPAPIETNKKDIHILRYKKNSHNFSSYQLYIVSLPDVLFTINGILGRKTQKGTWADEVKLRIGDELVSINGQAVSQFLDPDNDWTIWVGKGGSLRIQICPEKGISPVILLWGWDWDHQTYSRKGYGSLGVVCFGWCEWQRKPRNDFSSAANNLQENWL